MAMVPSPMILSTDEMGRIAPPIFAPVGRGGENRPGDVFVIQSLLNDRLPRPHSDVPVTGEADIGTVLAIEAYQAVVLRMIPPTGRVEPGSATYYALASRPMVQDVKPNATGRFGRLPPEVVEAAVASQVKWSVPASITLAQWVVESAWGGRDAARQQQPVRDQGGRRPARGRERHTGGDRGREHHDPGQVPQVCVVERGVRLARAAFGYCAGLPAGDEEQG